MLNVFITGASSGIGAALAAEYARQGARLGLVARRHEALATLQNTLPNTDKHRIYALDVNDHVALANAAADFLQTMGVVHVVIANAGISVGTLSEHAEDLAIFARVIATNVTATVATFAPFITPMKNAQQQARALDHAMPPCRLVGIASVAGIRGLPGAEAYSASKAAVISYCESLRVELRGSGIEVVTIAPGYIDTPMTQANHYAMPFLMPVERFAAAALRTIAAGTSYAVIPWQMGVVAKLLRLMPNWLYDRLMAKAPHKARVSASSDRDSTSTGSR